MVPCARPNSLFVSAWFRALMVPREAAQPCGLLCVAAQFYVLRALHGAKRGRTLRCLRLCFRALLRVSAQLYELPRSLRAAANSMVPRAAERFVFSPVLPRSGLDCYKRAVSSTVEVSRAAAVVKVGRRRIVVEYSRSTVVVGKSCSYSIFDVEVIFRGLSSIIEEVDLFDRRLSGVI